MKSPHSSGIFVVDVKTSHDEQQFWKDAAELRNVKVELRLLFAAALVARLMTAKYAGQIDAPVTHLAIKNDELRLGRKLYQLGLIPEEPTP